MGYIGGKTQTDIGGMDDLYIEGKSSISICLSNVETQLRSLFSALGITEDVEKYSLKGTKRKKGKKLDEDYLVIAFTSI